MIMANNNTHTQREREDNLTEQFLQLASFY